MTGNLLDVRNLCISFPARLGSIQVVHDVTFGLQRGQTLAIVGESGAGKSVTGLSILRLRRRPGTAVVSGQVIFEGCDLMTLPEKEMHSIRGKEIGVVFQNAMTSLNPFLRVSEQLTETTRFHLGLDSLTAHEQAITMLERVGIRGARARVDSYPHEFSGGMRQRVMMAMALSCQPKLLIADEPTTALDLTTQYQILQLIRELQEQTGVAVLLITHDISLAAKIADQVVVMKNGRIVESAPTAELLEKPSDPYTQRLIKAATGRLEGIGSTASQVGRVLKGRVTGEPPLLSIQSLDVCFQRSGAQSIHAVDRMTLDIRRGETLGLVGESGSGKTTAARAILQLVRPTSGKVLYDDGRPVDLVRLPMREITRLRRRIQMVFQDPYSSLNPRMTIGETLREPIQFLPLANSLERDARVREVLAMVELDSALMGSYPHELSGGQLQRVSIARALAVQPELLVADEPVASLDVITQLQVLQLLYRLRKELNLTVLFISHDLRVVRSFCDRVAVLYRGRIVELAEVEDLFSRPLMPYSRALLSASTLEEPLLGSLISADDVRTTDSQQACCYYGRCAYAVQACEAATPELQEIAPNHFAACSRISPADPNIDIVASKGIRAPYQ